MTALMVMAELTVSVAALAAVLSLGWLWHKRRMYHLETERRALAAVDRDLYGVEEYPQGQFTLRCDASSTVKYVDGVVVTRKYGWGDSERPATEEELETVRKMVAARARLK